MSVSSQKTTGALENVSIQLEGINANAHEAPMATTPSEIVASSPQLPVSMFHLLITH